jgi:hypothetical protein
MNPIEVAARFFAEGLGMEANPFREGSPEYLLFMTEMLRLLQEEYLNDQYIEH